ncbi:restriction endonuclease subunit S [Streptomyces sp. NBC_00882]|uniref:restriction endonuclease subunit S n=1 Tax=Streptomyces sp. NBC_00882 TaxID=2975856 RepID=UPI0038640B31|nr:restriction endonuclease subunit S [Streptomyces sp. NBC_00882]
MNASVFDPRSFSVPGDYKFVRLGYVARLQNGLTVDAKRDITGDVVTRPYLRVANVQAGSLNLESVAEITVPRSVARRSMLRPGDVLMTEGGDLDKLGRGTVWQGELEGCLHQNHIFAIRPDPQHLVGRYLAYLTQSLYGRCYFESTGTKTTNLASTNSSKIQSFPLPLPPLEKQCYIVDYLDSETSRIGNLVRVQRELLEKLQERRAAGVVAAVSGAIGPDRERRDSTLAWLETVPAHWSEVGIGLVARMGSGHTPSRSHPEWWVDCTIPWITTGEVRQVRDDRQEVISETREKISQLGLENSAAELHPAGTVVLCRTASAGYSGVMGTAMTTSQDFATWTCGPKLDPYYLLWCLRAMRDDLLGRLAMGSTHKTIYVPDLQMLRIPLPPVEEQREIVSQIRRQNTKIDTLVDAANHQLALLAERRQALITAAVTGQLDVTSAPRDALA